MARTKPRPVRELSQAETEVEPPGELPLGITNEDLVDFFTRMVLVRTTDERVWALNPARQSAHSSIISGP